MATTYEKIASTTLGSANTTITFDSITGTYTDLKLIIVATATSTSSSVNIRLNNDSGSNYSMTRLFGNGSSASSGRLTNRTQIDATLGGFLDTTPVFLELDLFSYSGSTNKTVLLSQNEDNNGSGYAGRAVSLWRNTAAITRIDIICTQNMDAGTTATIYGILKA
jgi:hypothetical protein